MRWIVVTGTSLYDGVVNKRMDKKMKRRSFLKGSLAFLATPHLGSRTLRAAYAQPQRPPNIIYILADDLGYGDLGSYGQKKFKTPFLDAMAAEGIRFTDHYAGGPVCRPSRCALMTGLHTGHARIRGNAVDRILLHPSIRIGGKEAIPLLAEDVTVAEVLKKADYTTGIIGKWALGEPGTTGLPNRQGFDYFFGFLNQRKAHFHYPPFIWRNEDKLLLQDNESDGLSGESYVHDMFTREALDFVRRNRKGPFLLYLPYTLPHSKYTVPADSMAPYQGAFPETPFAHQPTPRAAYAGMVSRLDRDVGRLLMLLKELELDDDTLVMFSSDNGAAAWVTEFFESNGRLRGAKLDLYEGGIRVPFIARWPGRIKAGTITDLPSAFWDVLPTVAEVVGVEPPNEIDGLSFLPTLLGASADQRKHAFLYWEFIYRTTIQAVRMGQWKAIRHAPNDSLELYNLEDDIGEQRNLATARPDVVKEIEAYLLTARVPSEHWPMLERTPWTELRRRGRGVLDTLGEFLPF